MKLIIVILLNFISFTTLISAQMNIGVINDPDGYTNIRKGPNTQSQIIGKIIENEQFEYIPNDSNWWQVTTKDGKEGYVHKSRIKDINTSSKTASVSEKEKIFNNFMNSSNLKIKEKTYWYIIQHQNEFSGLILKELKKYKGKLEIPDHLIYIATVVRRKKFIEYLVSFIQNNEYSESSCIYACPIVFSLTIYKLFSKYPFPNNLNQELMAVSDLTRNIEFVKKMQLINEIDNGFARNFVSDDLIKQAINLSEDQLIKQAGHSTKNWDIRLAAAIILSNTIVDSKNINRLYWLAITEYGDAISLFRSEIYTAIYRAEKSRN